MDYDDRRRWTQIMKYSNVIFPVFCYFSVISFSDTVYSGREIQILNEKFIFADQQNQFRPVNICIHSAWHIRTTACNIAWRAHSRQGIEWNFISLLCSLWETFHLLSASDKGISKISVRSLFFLGRSCRSKSRSFIQKWKMSICASCKLCFILDRWIRNEIHSQSSV
jgi:hypothetical protein